MITPEFARTFARYNQWQNEGLIEITSEVSDAAMRKDRGAFFGSLLATLNHLLWGDRIWMSRIDGWDRPQGGIPTSPDLHPDWAAWRGDRVRCDARYVAWADGLRATALEGDLTWLSGSTGREITKPLAVCVIHMFNHQTHHRGQVHSMLTGMGLAPQATDMFLMPSSVV